MNYMRFNEGGSMEDLLRKAMEARGKKGPQDMEGPEMEEKGEGMNEMREDQKEKGEKKEGKMVMVGQYTSPVQREGDREYVLYEHPNGQDTIKVYGNWNEYASSRDSQGRDMLADDDYPIYMDENGEYVLDERAFELGEGMDEYKELNENVDQNYAMGGYVKKYMDGGRIDSTGKLRMMLDKMRGR